MKIFIKIISMVISVVMLLTAHTPTALAAERPIAQEAHYIDIEIPYETSNGNRSETTIPLANSPRIFSVPFFPGFLPAGVNEYMSNIEYIDLRDDSIPITARISKITITSTKNSVPGLDYFIGISRNTPLGVPHDVILPWDSPLTINGFNDEDPWGVWGFYYYVKRNEMSPDLGLGVPLSPFTVRIYYSV